MYAGAVIVPLIVGAAMGMSAAQLTYLVSIDLAASGLATLLQIWKNKFFGVGLPVVLGCTFTAVAPMISIGKMYGMGAISGSILVSGVVVLLIAKYFSKIMKIFPPVVIGSVVTIIGITLIPVAISDIAGTAGTKQYDDPKNLALAFGVLLLILFIQRFFKGFIRSIAVLIGLIAGTIAAYFMGMVDLTSLKQASWFHLLAPLHFAVPTFHIDAIITMVLVSIVSLIESSGTFFALSEICEQPLSENDLERGYRSEGLALLVGSLFNAFPYTTFSQNVGLVQLSGVRNRRIIFVAGSALIVFGLIPKIGALTTLIPNPVLGGAMVAMFGMVATSGIRMLGKVDFNSQENLLIIACSIGMGVGITVQPDLFSKLPQFVQILTSNGIVTGSLTAIILNVIFNVKPRHQRAEQRQSVVPESKAV
ncbi:nucleobase:cation symporter-2 family protein [Pullulanibacillus sp. KACC 23026]|uniref:nucleobase:cation symporter-2 family protein n=1 Tax=Pullulanibacillus sp. KACC 23026 TaxID=3028315 RepID=UPI0023AE7CDD|nr:nucleobase:cation symporter-2 family protein [Pullulanibacillus sp. KACC 23026]WEG15025.1 nucleobase:cation symporter-2 family protein [Pullulanibacillus sp. KACC 23026]